jgi:chromate transporter
VVVVVVGAAVITLAQSALRRPGAMILAAAVTGLVIAGMNEALALVIGGITSMIVRWRPTSALTIVLLPDLFAYFLKAGSTTFGSGYVLFAILRADLVDRAGWLSEAQLLDAIAVGQVTPGPVFTAATFIGYVLAGPGGAAVATVGMFLPAFIFAALSARFLAWLAGSAVARAFLDGVTAAAVALIGVVVVGLAPHAIVDVSTGAIAIAAALAIGWFRVNAAWVILAAVAMGFAARLL